MVLQIMFLGNFDILDVSKTKLDAFFSIEQFEILNFLTPFRKDCYQHGGGLLVFVKEDIPAKHLSSKSTPIKGIYIELNFRKKKLVNWQEILSQTI